MHLLRAVRGGHRSIYNNPITTGVVRELIRSSKDIPAEHRSGEEGGLDQEETSFYDVLDGQGRGLRPGGDMAARADDSGR
ncbi:MAG: type I restriction enzyme endonuclease domain-containing protein [Alphaproteobacteria bacterium]